MTNRQATVSRTTKETSIEVTLSLDNGDSNIKTGLSFFDHMLAQTARHGKIAIQLHAAGDLHVDAHHTVEDCGIVLGQALAQILQNKMGIARFGYAYAPLDEALTRVVIDLSGRPSLNYHAVLSRTEVGGLESDLLREFFQAFCNHAKITLHIDLLRGINSHHQAESIFKAFGLALNMATAQVHDTFPSTKGML